MCGNVGNNTGAYAEAEASKRAATAEGGGGYLDGMDLPPSDSESEEEAEDEAQGEELSGG